MSEKRQNPELEPKDLKDEDLKDVAGGMKILPNIQIEHPDQDEPGKPDILKGGAGRKPAGSTSGLKK